MKIDLDSNISKLQNVSPKKITNNDKNLNKFNEVLNESTVDLHNSRPEAVTYSSSGAYRRNLNNMVKNDNDICDCKKPEFQQKPNLTGSTNMLPQVPVKTIVNMSYSEVTSLSSKACVKPLSDHCQEMGKVGNMRYVVIDGVRYESKVPESETYKTPKTLIEILNEVDKESVTYKKNKDNEYELSGMPKSSITVGNSVFATYGQIDERTKKRIEEILGSIN